MKIHEIDWTAGTEYKDNFGTTWTVDSREENLRTEEGDRLESLYTFKEVIRDLIFTQKTYITYKDALLECMDKGTVFISIGKELSMYKDHEGKVYLNIEASADMTHIDIERSEWSVW